MTLKEMLRFRELHTNMFNRETFIMEEYEDLRCRYFEEVVSFNYGISLHTSIDMNIEYYIDKKIKEALND